MNLPLLFGPYGSTAIPYIDRLSEYGANTLWFHGFDPEVFEACELTGITACVEFKTFRADFNKRPELIPIGVDGLPIRYGDLVQGVCLSQQDFLQETEGALLSGIMAYKPTGIWLDYLTYGGWFETPNPDLQESCFCPACIDDFCSTYDLDAVDPEKILNTYPDQWTTNKCVRIARFSAHYADLIRAHLPDCIIGAYMCPWNPGEFEGALRRIFAQDYELMASSIDIFTPLIYARKSGRRPEWGREFLGGMVDFIPQDRAVMLILDALDFPESLLTVSQSSLASYGIQMFNGWQVFSEPGNAEIFRSAVERIREIIMSQG
jgi:hypothetical protein